MSYYYPSTKGRHSIDISKSNGHQKQQHHKKLHYNNHLQHHHHHHHHPPPPPSPSSSSSYHQYNQHTQPIYQYKRWSYDKGVEEFIPPYVRKYNRRNKQLFNLLKGTMTTTTTTTTTSAPGPKRRRNNQRKHHYHSHKNPKWLIEDLFEEQKANPNNPNANNENQYNYYMNKRRTTTKSAVTAGTTTTVASATTTTSTIQPPVDDEFKLLVQNNFPGVDEEEEEELEDDVSVEMNTLDDMGVPGVDSEKEAEANNYWQQEMEKSYGNQNSLIDNNNLSQPPSIRRSHLGRSFDILYEKSKEMKNQTVQQQPSQPVHQFFYHRIDAPRTVGVGESGRKQRLPFVAITDRRLDPSKVVTSGGAVAGVAALKRENNILPMP